MRNPQNTTPLPGMEIMPKQPTMTMAVLGDSMRPTFAPGDQVMVNTAQPQELVDGFWAVRLNETTLVKRIQSLPGGRLLIISDNPLYPAFEVGKDQPGFALIGRVVYAARRM